MATDPLTTQISDRICTHMNSDHCEALLAYANHYGGCDQPKQAKMLAITANSMELEVDGKLVEIPFDHTLTDSEDAHRSLVAMLKAIP